MTEKEIYKEAIAHFEYGIKHDIYSESVASYVKAAVTALRAQREVEKDDPLTLDELRKLDGEPVWLMSLGEDFEDGWYIITKADRIQLHCLQLYVMLYYTHYGTTWIAYRHKPKEESNN